MTVEKAGLKFNIQKTKIMSWRRIMSSPISSWQIEEEKVETVIDFIFLDFKTTADGDCSYDKPRRGIKRRGITWPIKVHIVKAMVFSVVIVSIGQLRRLSTKELMLLNFGAGGDSWESLGLQVNPKGINQSIKSNQSILKEINPDYSLEGLMLKLKLQSFGHLMWRTNSLGKNLMLRKTEGKRRRGQQRMRWLDSITNLMDMNLNKLREIGRRGEPGVPRGAWESHTT